MTLSLIDEAYSLTGDRSEPDSFSREAIAQLVIELEEHAEDKTGDLCRIWRRSLRNMRK